MQGITRHAIPILLILTAFGGFLRFHNLSSAPYWMDEGFTITAVKAIEEHGTQILDSGFSYTCPLYCYPSAWFVTLFGSNQFSYRLLAAIAGTLFIPALFYILRRMLSLRITLLSVFFVALSYFQIAWSRQARWYTLFELFFWLSLFGFYKAYYEKEKRRLWIGLTIVFTLIATQSHELGYLLPLIFAGWMLVDAIVQKRMSWRVATPVVAMAVIATLFLAKYLGAEANYLFPLYLNYYFKTYWLFLLLSIVSLFHPYNVWKKETNFLLFVLLAYVIPLSFLTDIINYRYLFHVTPIFFILGSIGIGAIVSDLKRPWAKIVTMAVIVILFFVSGAGVVKPQGTYFLEADAQHFFVPQPDWNAAYAFIKENKKEGEVVVTTQSPFNKIFLGEPGYWIRYSYNGKTYMKEKDDREFYVGATIINDANELQSLASTSHGYLVMDFYGEGMMAQEIRTYIEANFTQVFEKGTNDYSSLRVYRF